MCAWGYKLLVLLFQSFHVPAVYPVQGHKGRENGSVSQAALGTKQGKWGNPREAASAQQGEQSHRNKCMHTHMYVYTHTHTTQNSQNSRKTWKGHTHRAGVGMTPWSLEVWVAEIAITSLTVTTLCCLIHSCSRISLTEQVPLHRVTHVLKVIYWSESLKGRIDPPWFVCY